MMIRSYLALMTLGLANAFAADDLPLHLMDGAWVGDGRYIAIDTRRMQANLQLDKPFQRDTLIIRNISGKMITFQINSQNFIGLFDGPQLRLTGNGIEGSVTLRRVVRP